MAGLKQYRTGRRRAMGFLALAIAGFAAQPASADDKLSPPGDFRQLPELASRNGVLTATLTAEPKVIVIDGVRLDALVFNGEYGGPVLRLKPGDRMRLKLVDHTSLAVNLHFHGSHASPGGHGDNMHVQVAPGGSFDYRLTVPPDQPPGLYWYHTHIHGLAEQEVNGGLSGAMIIDGAEKWVPAAAGARARLLVLKTYTLARPDDADVARLHGVVQSINGAAHADIVGKAGATEFWRISNQSPNDYYHLSIKGLHFRIVGLDGAATGQPIDADRLDIPPAGRIEALVTLPGPGAYPLLSNSTPTGVGRAMKVVRELAMLKVEGTPPPVVAAATPPAAPAPPPQAADLSQAALSAKRLIVFSQKPGEEVYLINGKVYDHDRIDTRVPLGSIEEWTIRNTTDDMHVFHIHQVHFQVMSINGEPQPFDRVLDTVRVPEQGEVVLRIPFTNPLMVGEFMYHCHVLKHEDKGMMANIEVYDPKAGLEPEHRHGGDAARGSAGQSFWSWLLPRPSFWAGAPICHAKAESR